MNVVGQFFLYCKASKFQKFIPNFKSYWKNHFVQITLVYVVRAKLLNRFGSITFESFEYTLKLGCLTRINISIISIHFVYSLFQKKKYIRFCHFSFIFFQNFKLDIAKLGDCFCLENIYFIYNHRRCLLHHLPQKIKLVQSQTFCFFF